MRSYYEDNHQEYFRTTVGIDPTTFLEPLADRLRSGATVLDIGCGSGRDLLWFRERCFQPTGFEGSSALARLAEDHSGCPVIVGDFSNYDFSSHSFDALVFVGSLVHQSKDRFPSILAATLLALNPGGHILITMKEGKGTSSAPDGRHFILWSREALEAVFAALSLTVLECSRKESKLRAEDVWLGFVLRAADGR